MQALSELWYRMRGLFWPALAMLATAYFGYHTIQGDRGLIAYAHTAMEIKRMEAELAVIAAERQRLAARADLLHPDRVEPDMLDEQVRRTLGLAHPDELIVFAN
jgi:cell division protein FtsB